MLEKEKYSNDDQSVEKRRVLLRGTVGALGVLSFAPTNWTKPVIESVILPAHAQTSSGTGASTPPCPTERFAVPDQTFGCITTGAQSIFLEIQLDSNGCASLNVSTTQGNADIVFIYELLTTSTTRFFMLEIDSDRRGTIHEISGCTGSSPSLPPAGSFTFDFTAGVDNSNWRISYDLTSSTVTNFSTVSNIVVARP